MQTTGDGTTTMSSPDSGNSDGKSATAPDNLEYQERNHEGPGVKNHPQQERVVQSQGEPIDAAMTEFSGGGRGASGSSRSTPEKPFKGILKNREMRSPLTHDAFNYSGPTDSDTVRDNNYDEDENRFSKLVDSRELHSRKIKAGLVKKRVRNSSTESAPELTFYPKRQDRNDDPNDPKGSPSRKPPLTV